MSRKRSVMKPITGLWWPYCRTNRENLCTFFWYRNLLFSGKRLSVICVRIPAILGRVHSISLSHILFVKKCEQSIWFDFCELKFNTISIVRAY
jgi:hypothetical protein